MGLAWPAAHPKSFKGLGFKVTDANGMSPVWRGEGRIAYVVGSACEAPFLCSDKELGCAPGLHLCSFSYAWSVFDRDRCRLFVVSFPEEALARTKSGKLVKIPNLVVPQYSQGECRVKVLRVEREVEWKEAAAILK